MFFAEQWRRLGNQEHHKEEAMLSKLLSGLILACLLGTSSSVAQDPIKVAPTHYKLDFENEHVQVLYIHYGPHEKSAMHAHPGGVVVNLTNGHLRFTDPDGKTREVRAIHGEARWFPAFKHQVENLDDTTYDAIYIAPKVAGAVSALTPGADRLTEKDIAAIFSLTLLAHHSTH
jgi:hypothetical protein